MNLAEMIGGVTPDAAVRLRQATVVGAPSGGTATIRFADQTAAAASTVNGVRVETGSATTDDIAGVRHLNSVALADTDTVWVLQAGGALLIIGKVGAPPTTTAANWTVGGQLRVTGRSYFWDGLELGQASSTPYIDFHRSANPEEGTDYNVRLINDASDVLHLVGGVFQANQPEMSYYRWDSTWATFGHKSRMNATSTSYCLMHHGTTGETLLNSENVTRLRQGGNDRLSALSDRVTSHVRFDASNQVYAWGWFRSQDNSTGWYSEPGGGGWYMIDTTWIRSYGSKSVFMNGTVEVGGLFYCDARMKCFDGLHFYDINDYNHRVYMNAGANGPTLCGYGSAQLSSTQYDIMAEAGRNSGTVRHVNNASNAWKDSEAATHWNRSDPQEKKDIRQMAAGQLAKVRGIKPIVFKDKHAGKPNFDPADREHFGFDATELPPEAVKVSYLQDEDDADKVRETLMVNPAAMLAILWQAVQELTTTVEGLSKGKG